MEFLSAADRFTFICRAVARVVDRLSSTTPEPAAARRAQLARRGKSDVSLPGLILASTYSMTITRSGHLVTGNR
jgi:hypothetical protein